MSALALAPVDLQITLWPGVRQPWGQRRIVPWTDFVRQWVGQPEPSFKKEIGGFSLALFEGDGRALDRVEGVFALGLDFDQGDATLDTVSRLFPSKRAVVYTTWSSTKNHLKLRGIWPFSRPVSPQEFEKIWPWAQARAVKANIQVDLSTRDASRFWFLPSYHPDRATGPDGYQWREMKGRALDVEEILRQALTMPKAPMLALKRGVGVGVGVPGSERRGGVPENPAVPVLETFWGSVFVAAGLAVASDPGSLKAKASRGTRLPVACPWGAKHKSGFDAPGSTVVLSLPVVSRARAGDWRGSDDWWGLFKCSHASCAERSMLDLLDVLPASAFTVAREKFGSGFARALVTGGYLEYRAGVGSQPTLRRWRLNLVDADGVVLPEMRVVCPTSGYESAQEVFRHAFPGLRWSKALEKVEGWRERGQLPFGRKYDVVVRGGGITWLRAVKRMEPAGSLG